jgi:hypothetical protein
MDHIAHGRPILDTMTVTGYSFLDSLWYTPGTLE